MKIKRMTATFAQLTNATLELGEGLNLIEAPNEGGKSTWSAFIRAMLYGIPTKERDRQGFIAEKNRYQPWSGAAMEGKIELEWQGQSITLRRSQNRTVAFGKCEVVDSLTGEPIPGFTGENVGELLLGVPREVFERSAFVGQGAAAVDGAPALEKRISALVSSGEEDVSYSQVERRLRDWLNRRKHNKTGVIPKLEEELEELREALARQEKAHRTAQEAARAVEELQQEQGLLRDELSAHKYQAESSRRATWEQAQSELAAVQDEEARILTELNKEGATPSKEALRSAQEELGYLRTVESNLKLAERQQEEAVQGVRELEAQAEEPLFSGLSPDEAWQKASRDAASVAQWEKERSKLPTWAVVATVLGIVAGLGVIAAGMTLLTGYRLSCVVGGGILMLATVLCVSLLERDRRSKLNVERSSLLRRYDATFPDDILTRANEYRERMVQMQEAQRKVEILEQAKVEMITERETLKRKLLVMIQGFAPTARDGITMSAAISKALFLQEKLEQVTIRREGAEKLVQRLPAPQEVESSGADVKPRYDGAYTAARLSAVDSEVTRLSSVLAMAQGELNTLGDPAEAQARQEIAKEALVSRREEYQALNLAMEGLSQANRGLQARFSPALNQRAGELMAQLTGGKYDKVILTKEFEAMAEEHAALMPRRVLTLSQGTADQLYLAVRLAVCELALPGEDPAPLVLDDALGNFDDGRMALALDLLQGLAKKRQILLFTCHSREGSYLSGRDGVTVLPLHS